MSAKLTCLQLVYKLDYSTCGNETSELIKTAHLGKCQLGSTWGPEARQRRSPHIPSRGHSHCWVSGLSSTSLSVQSVAVACKSLSTELGSSKKQSQRTRYDCLLTNATKCYPRCTSTCIRGSLLGLLQMLTLGLAAKQPPVTCGGQVRRRSAAGQGKSWGKQWWHACQGVQCSLHASVDALNLLSHCCEVELNEDGKSGGYQQQQEQQAKGATI